MRRQGMNSNGEVMQSNYVEHDPVGLDASHDGCTRQEFADECDINVLMERYERTGVINHYNAKPPAYLDVTEVPDLHSALAVMDEAQAAFMTLSAKVRREFDNDPLQFVEFASDPANLEQMREWGLAPPAPVEAPASAAPVPPLPLDPDPKP